MSMKYHDLMNLPEDKLIQLYDEEATNVKPGLDYYTEEIARRRTEKSDKLMIRLTVWITVMTFVMLVTTIINIFCD